MKTPRRAYARAMLVRRSSSAVIAAALMAASSVPVEAQEASEERPDAEAEGSATGVSPRGAFIRALLVPGWGHAAIGSYTRAGFYFAAETATAYTLLRTRHRLSEARAHRGLVEGALRQDLAAQGVTEPEEIEALLAEDESLRELRELVEAREQQQEDLVAFGIFLLFLSGADAYVSAHLADFPAPISLDAEPRDREGRMDLMLRLRLP